MHRAVFAVALALASLVLAVVFGVVTAICGGMEQGDTVDVATGTSTSYGPHCVAAFHPLAPVWASLAILGAAALRGGLAWPAILLGAISLALGIISGFSAGFFGIGCGVLLLAAGLVGRGASDRPGLPDPT